MTNKIGQNEAGFSLVELMIAMTIFAIGLLATASMQITALQGNAGAQKRTSLNTVAAGVMEEILTWAPDDPRLAVTNPTVAHLWDFDPATTETKLILEGAVAGDVKSRAMFSANYFVTRDSPRPSIATVRLVVRAEGGITSWGDNQTTITCLKRTQ